MRWYPPYHLAGEWSRSWSISMRLGMWKFESPITVVAVVMLVVVVMMIMMIMTYYYYHYHYY